MAGSTDFLGAIHPIYKASQDAWEREERRMFGGDAVLEELFPFLNENAISLVQRRAQAEYVNFPDIHASLLAGHLHSVAPMPNFGSLGEVRSRDDLKGKATLAELIYYNADGIGNDGSQWDSYMLTQQLRAIALGHVWTLIEMPAVAQPGARAISKADVLAGARPYLVSYSPLDVPYWETSSGRLDCAILRVPVLPEGKALWQVGDSEKGYYVLTRAGFTGFGSEYEGGGWWVYTSEKKLTANVGDWTTTLGQIPFVPLFGQVARGTEKFPAISKSLTMELGQIAVSLMNRVSERDYDARDAAKSIKYILGVSPEAWAVIETAHAANAVLVPVPGTVDADGKVSTPTVYDGSSGAIAATVYETLIASTIAMAKEIMVRQVTSTPDSSGASKQAGFSEATSPLLAGLAARRETFENAVLTFIEYRAGSASPGAFVNWPKEFDLSPVLSKVERTLARERDAMLVAPTLRAELIERAATEDGTWPTDAATATAAREELLASAKTALGKQQGEVVKMWLDATAPIEIALERAGVAPAIIAAWIAAEPEPSAPGDPTSGDPTAPPSDGTAAPVTTATEPGTVPEGA